MEEEVARFEKNAPGPWYTTGGCLWCGAPEAEAPELFAPLVGDNFDTFFVRQPRTRAEERRAVEAALSCCLATVRYGGTDPVIIRRLGNHPRYCDHLLAWERSVLPDRRAPGPLRARWMRVVDAYRRWFVW